MPDTLFPAAPSMVRRAQLSRCGTYRYTLERSWSSGPRVAFVGLNPSTADAEVDDPTIRRCVGFARRWGFSGLLMVNLFAYRATDPDELLKLDRNTAIGPENDDVLRHVHVDARLTVSAWGAHPAAVVRAQEVEPLLRKFGVLGVTKSGAPRHPLYMRKTCEPLDPLTGRLLLDRSPQLTAQREGGS